MQKVSLYIFLFLVSFCSNAASDLHFEHINVDDGLSQSWVSCIEQDNQGFMWFGTSDGLNRYDGYSFTIFKNELNNSNSLINNHIQCMTVDFYGRLWIGTIAGICYYDQKINQFYTNLNIAYNSIDALLAADKLLYICTVNGIKILDLTTHDILHEASNQLNQQIGTLRVSAISEDKNGNLWLGTDEGLVFYDIKLAKANRNIISQHYNISAITIEDDGLVWVGTENNGLFVLQNNAGEPKIIKHLLSNDGDVNALSEGKVLAIYKSETGNYWVGIENGGLCILSGFGQNENTISRFVYNPSKKHSLSNNSIYNIFEDNQGNIWIGTYGDGVNFYNSNGANFSNLQHVHNEKNSLVNDLVNVVLQVDDYLFVGTEGGISKIDLNSNDYQLIDYSNQNVTGLQSNAIWALHPDKEKNIWIGTWGGGLNKMVLSVENNDFTFDNPSNSITAGIENVFSIAQQDEDIFWLGTMGSGLYFYNQKENEYKEFTLAPYEKNIISNRWIRHVFINSSNELWFSTTTSVGYINLNDTSEVVFYHGGIAQGEFKGEGAYVIFEDSKSTMWFGSDAGLNYFVRDKNTFYSYSITDGLPNNSVKSILEDDHGNLWLGTNRGLSELRNAVLKPKAPKFTTYDKFDGLQANEFNRRSAFKNKEGLMYFGGVKGLSYFHPDEIKRNTVPPKIVFTDFRILNKSVNISENSPLQKHINFTENIILSSDQTVFSIEFAALNYVSSPKNQYMYKLDGFDVDWVEAKNGRIASYTNLDPGTYTFMVKASNNDGVWNETPRYIILDILPPWYKTQVALFGYIFLFFLTLFAFIRISQRRYRMNEGLRIERMQYEQDKELNQQRLQFFTNISHEFRTPLTLIYSPLQAILAHKQLPLDVKNRLQTVYKNAIRLNRLISELMDFRKLQFNKLKLKVGQYDVGLFLANIVGLFEEEARQNKVDLVFDTPKDPILLWFDQHMIEKVVFNLLSNAFKVSPEKGQIKVSITVPETLPDFIQDSDAEQWLSIQVKDEGPGLKEEQKEKIFERFYQVDNVSKTYYSSTGIGLALAKNLVEMHKGHVLVESEEGQGARFSILLKRNREHFENDDIISVNKDIISYDIDEEQYVEETNEEANINSKNITLLIVEDNHELRKYLAKELSNTYKIIEAKNGLIGLEKTLEHLPDVVVSDVLMPEINGYELTQAIKSNEKISHIPVILLTARASVEDQIEGAASGADAYLTKPFNPKLLKTKIAQLIISRQHLFAKYSAELNLIPKNDSFTVFDQDFLKKVSEYIIENISNSDLTVEELGDNMALSRSQLYRKIKSLSGYSANEFIRKIRLEQAKKLIEAKKMPIGEVGYSVGFSSPSYFSKCYKEHFGNLPSEA